MKALHGKTAVVILNPPARRAMDEAPFDEIVGAFGPHEAQEETPDVR